MENYTDTLHLNTKKFNTLMDIRDIKTAYRTGVFPNSYCMFCTTLDDNVYLKTESDKVLKTENEKVVAVNGY